MSNTFDGILGEFPFIRVDRFDSLASVFLLTHCHADHTVGLNAKSVTGLIYCSQATKDLLTIGSKPDWANLVTVLDYNVATRLELPQHVESVYGPVSVTMISANHCVGSSMFLVENNNGSVLVTGDLRAEKWWCDGLRNIPALYPYLNGLRTLDNIYIDSTFGYRGEPYIEMPANNAGIHAVICLLREYPRDDPELSFVFLDTVLEFEQAWAFILSFFRSSLQIDNGDLRLRLLTAIKYDPVNGPALTRALKRGKSENRNGTFYAGKRETENENTLTVRIRQCIDFNVMDYAGVFCPLLLSSMCTEEQQSMELVRETQIGTKLYRVRDRLWIIPKGGTELLPVDLRLVFSRHSSYSETRDFVSMFQPKQVYPCWHSKTAWLNGFSMLRLFGSCCSGDLFHFDSIMRAQYGEHIKTTPVTTINRWDAESCRQEKDVVESIKDHSDTLRRQGVLEKNVALINIRRVVHVPVFRQHRTKEDQDFVRKRGKDFQFQKMVQGRREVSYRKFIESQQQLYYKRHNLPQYQRDFLDQKYRRKFDSALGGSSDYDSDSCDSSLDLAEMAARKSLDRNSQVSVVEESQPDSARACGLTRRLELPRSFVKSSFDSFEQSFPCQDSHTQSIYYNSEAPVDPGPIETRARQLRANPALWAYRETSVM